LALLIRDPVRQRFSHEAPPPKLKNIEAMLAVTVTKRPTVTLQIRVDGDGATESDLRAP